MQLQQYGTFNDITQIGPSHLGPLPIMTAKELRQSDAQIALGAAVDENGRFQGEVSMIDGHAFVTPYGGIPRAMADDELLGFAQFANMNPEGSQTITINAETPDDLIAECKKHIPSEAHSAFALRVKGHFQEITYRGMSNHDAEYGNFESFEEMEKASSTHECKNAMFSLSGVFQSGALPEDKKDMSPEGWHFHGLNEDKTAGGHITGFSGFRGTVEIMPIHEWHLSLNSAAQNHAQPSPLLTTKRVFHMDKVHAEAPNASRTNA